MSERSRDVHPHRRFSRRVQLDPDSVARFARLAGDTNPLHADARFAAGTRYGRRLASGPQTSALLMGCTASWFSERGPMVGLDFSFRFRRPVFADDEVTLEWLIVSVRPSERLGGDVVDLRGRLVDGRGRTAVGATGRVLLSDRL